MNQYFKEKKQKRYVTQQVLSYIYGKYLIQSYFLYNGIFFKNFNNLVAIVTKLKNYTKATEFVKH